MKQVSLPVSCDFSVSTVNVMLQYGRDHKFGPATAVFFNLEKDEAFPEWGIVFEGGDTVVSEKVQ